MGFLDGAVPEAKPLCGLLRNIVSQLCSCIFLTCGVFFFFNFYFALEYSQLTISDVTFSGRQQRDSVIYKHVYILRHIPLSSRQLHSNRQSSLCYTVGLCWLSILNIAIFIYQYQTSKLSFPPDNHKFTL